MTIPMEPLDPVLKVMKNKVDERILEIWNGDGDMRYIPLIRHLFPSIDNHPSLLLDPEFGPLIFRRGPGALVLIVDEKVEEDKLICRMIWSYDATPRWVKSSFFEGLNRVSRNELYLECGLLGV